MYNSNHLVNIAISVKNATLGNMNITPKQDKNTTGYSLIKAPTGMSMFAKSANYPLFTNPFTTMEMVISNKQNENAPPTNDSKGGSMN